MLKKRQDIAAAEQPDYCELSDQEDDPPAELGPSETYNDVDLFWDEPMDHSCTGYDIIDATDHTHSAAVTDDECLGQSRTEDELDQDDVYFQDFSGAGKVHRNNGSEHPAYSTTGSRSDNPYHPFVSQLDWDVA